MTDLLRYTEEQTDTKPEDLTLAHAVSAEIACMMAEEAGNRGDWESCRAWLEIADEQPFYKRIEDEPFEPAIESRTPRMGGLLPAARGEHSRAHAHRGVGRGSYQSQGLKSLDQVGGVSAERRADHRDVAPVQDDVAGMIAPDMNSPRLLTESVLALVAIAVAVLALALVAG
jgi:hypothetical protein